MHADRHDPAAAPARRAAAGATRSEEGDQKLVLFVDDIPDERAIYQTMLAHLGYRVLAAADGREFLRLLRAHRPDLVIVDLSMPRISGWSLIEEIRGSAALAETPVVVLTGWAAEANRDRAKALGVAAYFEKPTDPAEVAREICRLIGRPEPSAG